MCTQPRAVVQRSTGSHHHLRWTRSFTTCRGTRPVLAGLKRLANFADVAQLAERDHAMVEATSSTLVIRSTSGVSSHSVAACHGVGGAGCARLGPELRAARHRIRRDGSRVGTAEVDLQALVAQQAEQPPCKRQAARSNRRRGRQSVCRVRLVGLGPRTFNSGTRVRIPHATPVSIARWESWKSAGLISQRAPVRVGLAQPATEATVELTLRWRKSAAPIGRRRNPSPDGTSSGV